MNTANLIIVIFFLVFVLGFLLFLFFKNKKKSKPIYKKVVDDTKTNFENLLEVLKNKKSSTQELSECIDILLKDYKNIENFDNYEKAIIYLCNHPNTNKRLIIRLDTTLEKYNPSFKAKIASALKMGLDSRKNLT